MAELLVSASTGAMGSVLSKLATMMSDEYKVFKDVRGDIKELKKELEHMHAFLLAMADVEDPDEQTKLRVRDVRELSYDIEDSIDKFMVHIDHESSPKGGGFKVLVNKCKKLTSDIKIRRQIAKEVKDIKIQIKETSERYARYSGAGCSTRNAAVVDTRVLAVFKDASELVGLDGPSDELIKLINSEEGDSAHQLKVVSIVGFGGLGKTTLANHVYSKLGESFDCRAFVSISRNPDIIKILSSMLSQISNNNKATASTEVHEVIGDIRESLKDKRYFIVVDDIWNVQAWKIMEHAFANTSPGSRIMITTRKMDVAQACSSPHEDHVYKIQPLSEGDSKKLFFKRIFGREENCPSQLKEASDGILKKCGGLPLAIIAISSLLATGQRKQDQWEWVHRSIGFAFGKSSEVDGMRGILSLSYFDLPLNLRSCLMYLTLFPEDYWIQRLRLVHRWIAEGFISSQDGQDLVELGDMYFHELINRSLVQPVAIGYDGKAGGCRVHDTILDFLIQKSSEENFSTTLMSSNQSELPGVLESKVRRLSLLNAYGSDERASICPRTDTSHLRSYSIFGWGSKQLLSLISDFNYLRVLDLEGCNFVLEDNGLINIGRLYQLRYLNLINTEITSLPTNIGGLQYLETLNASNCRRLKKLPEAVTWLKQLVRLIVHSHTILPDGIGNLKNLQELGNYISMYRCSLNFLQELGELTQLRNLSIRLDGLEGDKACYMEKLVISLRKLDACNLRDLSLQFSGRVEGDIVLPTLSNIRRVLLWDLEMCKITKWLASLVNLEVLDICIDDVIEQQDIELIGSIPTLLYFSVAVQNTYNACPMVLIIRGFQQVQRFSFRSDSTGLMVQFEGGAMPTLKDLELMIHPPAFNSAVLGGSDFGIQYLSCLASITLFINCEGVMASDVEAAECAIKSMVQTHTNRPTLQIQRWYESGMVQKEETKSES